MIRMQKKTAEVKKEKDVAEGNNTCTDSPVNVDISAAEPKEEGGGGLSLLGIGGKQIKSGAKKTGKKRTPGEIRIQKGWHDDLYFDNIIAVTDRLNLLLYAIRYL